ncbi:MAG: hypothetical protein AB1467_04820 [Candidatus Diapherotrites archaeon]
MGIFDFFSRLFGRKEKKVSYTAEKIYEVEEKKTKKEHIISLWDYLKIIENTQAFHILSVLGFNEWVSMDEIKRRVEEVFKVNYKNDRSLYPYIKTLVDMGFLEAISAGGKRRWRKKDLIVKIELESEGKKEKEVIPLKNYK